MQKVKEGAIDALLGTQSKQASAALHRDDIGMILIKLTSSACYKTVLIDANAVVGIKH